MESLEKSMTMQKRLHALNDEMIISMPAADDKK